MAKELAKVREICLALPGATEKVAWGAPTWRYKDKLFAMFADNHHDDGRVALWCKASKEQQEDLVRSEPKRYFVPPYVGVKGWVGIRVDGRPKWGAVADLIEIGFNSLKK